MLCWLALVVGVCGQFVDEPPATMPYELRLADGSRVYGFIRATSWERAANVQVHFDQPWVQSGSAKASDIYKRADIREYAEETLPRWRARHLEGWTKAGYMNLGSASEFYFVAKSEVELAERAKKLARSAESVVQTEIQEVRAEIAPSAAPDDAALPGAPGLRGAIGLWGGHIAIATVAAGLIGLVVWGLLLR